MRLVAWDRIWRELLVIPAEGVIDTDSKPIAVADNPSLQPPNDGDEKCLNQSASVAGSTFSMESQSNRGRSA